MGAEYCPSRSACSGDYIIGPQPLTFNEAEEYCDSIGSHLATIKNDIDSDAVRTLCDTVDSTECWIGLTFYGIEEGWSWIDGSQLGEYGFDSNGNPKTEDDAWAIREPNGSNEDCVHLRKAVNFYWNDALCSRSNYPICNPPSPGIYVYYVDD